MKVLWLFGCLVLASACSSFGVRCDTRLRPINPPQAPADTAPDRTDQKVHALPSDGGSSGKP
jgi:hypothetical protein